MPTNKADLLHRNVSEVDISRLSDEAEKRLRSQSKNETLRSLSYLKFAFQNRNGSTVLVKTDPEIG